MVKGIACTEREGEYPCMRLLKGKSLYICDRDIKVGLYVISCIITVPKGCD
jgi:hypothetical protein